MVSVGQPVGGEKLDLLAATIVNDDTAGIASCNLSCYFPEECSARLVLRGRESVVGQDGQKLRYQVELKRRSYSAGMFTFGWSAEIINYYHLNFHDILPWGNSVSTGQPSLIPLLLFSGRPQIQDVRYEFRFVPRERTKMVAYSIFTEGGFTPCFSDTLTGLEGGREFVLHWNGKDRRGSPSESGHYILFVKAYFQPGFGAISPPVSTKYRFYHYRPLLQGLDK